MPLKVMNFSKPYEMELALTGGVQGGRSVVSIERKIQGLHGLTLLVNAATVTFSDPTGTGLTLAQVKQAIDTAASVTSTYVDGKLTLRRTGAVTVLKTGTANPIFGFSTDADTVGVVYAPPTGSAPRLLFITPSPSSDSLVVTVEVP